MILTLQVASHLLQVIDPASSIAFATSNIILALQVASHLLQVIDPAVALHLLQVI